MLSLFVALASAPGLVQEPPRPALVPTHVQVSGTQVLLAPPPGFTEAERYSGFESAETGASILVNEIPGPYAEVAAGLDAEGLKRAGMTLLESEEVEIAGREGLVLHATQSAQGVAYDKWIGVFGDAKRTVQVVSNCPEESAPGLRAALRACVRGAKWDRSLKIDPFAHLTFTLSAPPELKFCARIQNGVLFTRTGEINKGTPAEPMLTIAPSIGRVAITDVEVAATRRLLQLGNLSDVQIETSRAIEVSGLAGWEIVAGARDRGTETPLVVYQVMLLEEGGYHLMVAMAGAEVRETYLPVFVKTAASFALKPVAKPGDGPK